MCIRDRLSVTFHYIKIIIDISGKPADLKVNESFMEFFLVPTHTASGLKDLILNYLQLNNIDWKKCRGQAYDGATLCLVCITS